MDVGSLMMKLAPLVMGALGKQKQSNNLDAGGVFELLRGTTQAQVQQNPEASIFEPGLCIRINKRRA